MARINVNYKKVLGGEITFIKCKKTIPYSKQLKNEAELDVKFGFIAAIIVFAKIIQRQFKMNY